MLTTLIFSIYAEQLLTLSILLGIVLVVPAFATEYCSMIGSQ
jgi:hypothetical protein